MKVANLRIIGSGLIGTSIALKAIELGVKVEVVDLDLSAEKLARDLIHNSELATAPDLVVIATPPKARNEILREEVKRFPNATFIDVASVMTDLQVEIEGLSGNMENFIASHPIAGREISGARGARSDLFQGRAWIIAPSKFVSEARVAVAEEFITNLGATPYRMDAAQHDALFAAISHLPQALSIALALSLENKGEGISLAGQGLRDMLRLADSDSGLWREIFAANRNEVIAAISQFEESLAEVKASINSGDPGKIEDLFEAAAKVKASVGGKHGSKPREYTFVNIVIDDRPGQLASIFNECAAISVNIEDLTLEHSPQQLTGLIRLALSENDALKLHKHLESTGWRVHL